MPTRLNAVRVLRGRAPATDADDEVLVSGRFADANRLRPGDTLVAVINERRATLRIVGIGAAPDYLYEAAGGGMVQDERAFGILWAPHDLVMAATGMRGAFNDVAIHLAPGARPEHVIAAMDSVLAPYGGRGAIGRKDQFSHRVVDNELQQLAVMGFAFPVFFVAVAAFLAGTVLTRLIATEREQIAVLKAFGYTSRRGGAALSGICGGGHRARRGAAALAWACGSGASSPISTWTCCAFRVSASGQTGERRHSSFVVLSLAALAGAARAVRGAARLPPAEGMRPPAPARYRALLLDRLGMGRALLPRRRAW